MQKRYVFLGLLATSLFAGGLVFAQSISTQEEHQHNAFHEEMHAMMDSMMGEGFSHSMHEAMPGSEEMMEHCTSMMGNMDMMSQRGMMHQGMRMRGMMGG